MHLTSTFVLGLSHKRIVPFRKNPKFHDYDYVDYLNFMIRTRNTRIRRGTFYVMRQKIVGMETIL